MFSMLHLAAIILFEIGGLAEHIFTLVINLLQFERFARPSVRFNG